MEDLKLGELFYSTRELEGMIFLLTDMWPRWLVAPRGSKRAPPRLQIAGQSDQELYPRFSHVADASARARQCLLITSLPTLCNLAPRISGPTCHRGCTW
ncbi:hypothetical protein BAE44_0011108 [Dichanthelium oligosanthes]|uniref:Uncharacterized protein n=1 Tax=Dichanthelium oligosanthes TaxID=888268 RepID=A0A1E5VS18_9POAL|nr:hypothetical protein BAE44_0011108 [Dichanthelium oligosanthes]